LPGASEPRLRLLRPQDFRSVFQAALRGQGHRSIVVVCNYEFGPITAEPCRAKVRPLRPRRSCFAPFSAIRHQQSASQGLDPITDPCFLIPEWWRRRVLPPGPIGLFRRPFIAIAGLLRHPQYSPEPPDMKALNVRRFAKPSAGLRQSSLSLVKDRFHSSNTLDRSECAGDRSQRKALQPGPAPFRGQPLCFPKVLELCYAWTCAN
jgi:hypothetical protein